MITPEIGEENIGQAQCRTMTATRDTVSPEYTAAVGKMELTTLFAVGHGSGSST